jgi:hypothetical protein
MSEIWNSARPRWWLSAHYHQRISEQVSRNGFTTRFEILDCNLSGENGLGWMIVDNEALLLAGNDPIISPPTGQLTKRISIKKRVE